MLVFFPVIGNVLTAHPGLLLSSRLVHAVSRRCSIRCVFASLARPILCKRIRSCSPLLAIVFFWLLTATQFCVAASSVPGDGSVPLTSSEIAWIRSHPIVTVAPTPDFPPIEFFDHDGRFAGITADYLAVLGRKLGVTFTIRHFASWQEVMERTERGEVDLWCAATETASRARLMRFTKPYLSFPAVIIVRKGTYDNLTLDKLSGLKVVSLARHVTDDYLSQQYPTLNRIIVHDIPTGLKMVSLGAADAIVVNAAPASYYIGEAGLANLAIAGQSDVVWPLSFASRKDWPELSSIMQKALDSVTPAERQAIIDKWVRLDAGGLVSRRTFGFTMLIGLGAAALFIGLVLAVNRSLRRVVRQQTAELRTELDERRRAEEELRRYQADLETKTESLEAIRSIADSLYRSLDLTTVAERAADAMMLRSSSPSVAIYLLDESGQWLDMFYSRGFNGPINEKTRRLPVKGSLSGQAVAARNVAASRDVSSDTSLDPNARQFLLGQGYYGAVSVPLLAEDRVLGVFNLLYKECRVLSPGEEEELLVIGQTVGLAISNAINVAQLRREMAVRIQAEEALREAHDQLERKVAARTRELAEANVRLQELDHLKSMFLASMSHELRTPLNSIIGFTGILLQGMVGPLNDEQHKQLSMVKGSAHHLLALINDVLDISKIEAGELKVACAPFNLRGSIEKVVQAVSPLAEKKGLALVTTIAPEVGTLDGDERRVEQILLNLVGNAIKFTEAGQISVECAVVAEQVRLSITDTGIGIKGVELENIFKPFQQIDSGLTRKYEGTGLGLSICRKLLELMDGEIRVESEWGRGSTFRFSLPLQRSLS